ncbi:hypothetical protein ZWY2020_006297 [Hordeum vulgare]|nr:hypothetical protein ZWY2020_006297 [Hordeum vulgare]
MHALPVKKKKNIHALHKTASCHTAHQDGGHGGPTWVPEEAQMQGHRRRDGPTRSGMLLAGYIAHEFLARGTVLGERRAPRRVRAGGRLARGTKPWQRWCRLAAPAFPGWCSPRGRRRGEEAAGKAYCTCV